MPSRRGQLPGAVALALALATGAAPAQIVTLPYEQWTKAISARARAIVRYDDDIPSGIAAIRLASALFYVGPCRGRFVGNMADNHRDALAATSADPPGRFPIAVYGVLGLLTSQGMGRGDDYTCRFAGEAAAGK